MSPTYFILSLTYKKTILDLPVVCTAPQTISSFYFLCNNLTLVIISHLSRDNPESMKWMKHCHSCYLLINSKQVIGEKKRIFEYFMPFLLGNSTINH